MNKRARQKTYKELFRVGEVVEVVQPSHGNEPRRRWLRGTVIRISTRLHVTHDGIPGHMAYDRAMYNRGELRRAARFKIRETYGSRPGAAEVEIFAPDRYSFEGERHSLIARGATLEEAKKTALADALAMELIECAPDCDCKDEEVAPADPVDRKLALAVAVAALQAQRLGAEEGYPDHPWAYFAEEARSWFAVSTESMIKLADMIAARGSAPEADVIAAWAEQDEGGIELDRALGRRLGQRRR